VPRYIALLRAVNLGGATQISMTALREELVHLGCTGVSSLLQSGNLVFDSTETDAARLEARLESSVERDLHFSTEFMVRSAPEWARIVAGNPFPREATSDPGHLLVTVLKAAPRPAQWTALAAAIPGREKVLGRGREGYFHYPDGVGRSKLTATLIERHLGVRGTSRNWNTVLRLAARVSA
jgi:uncharacterized protein (DUF1697 family)